MMAGRQLPFVSLIVPAWLVVTMSGWRGLRGVWPAVLVCGGTFAVVQFAWSNYVGVELVDIAGGLASIAALALFCRVWQPREVWEFPEVASPSPRLRLQGGSGGPARCRRALGETRVARRERRCARLDAVAVPERGGHLCGGSRRRSKASLQPAARWRPSLERAAAASHGLPRLSRSCRRRSIRARISDPAYRNERAEAARLHAQLGCRRPARRSCSRRWRRRSTCACSFAQFLAVAGMTLRRMRAPLATIMLMLALGFVTRYGGTDATLGLAFTKTGWLYPFFAALLGWLGVALTGSDTSSNVLFGSLQKITASSSASTRSSSSRPTAPAASWAR